MKCCGNSYLIAQAHRQAELEALVCMARSVWVPLLECCLPLEMIFNFFLLRQDSLMGKAEH